MQQNVRPPSEIEHATTLMKAVDWYHRFEIVPGIFTPGRSYIHPPSHLDKLGVPQDLTGLRAADIGAWDGPLTFELERRGAHVIAIDIQDPDKVGFNIAKRILESQAEHRQMSVYDIPPREIHSLDTVLFHGVFYHLKYPLLAFEKISAAMKIGGIMYFEGEAFLHYAEGLNGMQFNELHKIAALPIPICLSYPGRYKGSENWFIPNVACLKSWLEIGGFEPINIEIYTDGGAQRVFGSAKKITDHKIQEHYLV